MLAEQDNSHVDEEKKRGRERWLLKIGTGS